MNTKFSDEWGDFEIRVNDPRGEMWIYKEASRALNIGWNHENPGRGHIYLSQVSFRNVESNFPPEELARSIARFFGFMVKPGGGYSSVELHIDKDSLIKQEDLAVIDQYLARFSMIRQLSTQTNQAVWIRATDSDRKISTTLH